MARGRLVSGASAVFAVLLVAGCSRPSRTASASGSATTSAVVSAGATSSSSVRYLALGDSFTIGTGVGPEAAFPSRFVLLQRAEGREVVLENPAKNGFTSADVLTREVPLLASFRPTFVTLAVGANDIVQHRSDEAYRESVRAIAMAVKSSGARFVALPQPDWAGSPVGQSFGPYPQLRARIVRSNAILREETERAGGRFLDLEPLMERQAKAALIAADGLHPSAEAHREWAEALLAAKVLTPDP